MILMTLSLMLTATLAAAAPMVETPPEAGANKVHIPICNTSQLSTVRVQDMAR